MTDPRPALDRDTTKAACAAARYLRRIELAQARRAERRDLALGAIAFALFAVVCVVGLLAISP